MKIFSNFDTKFQERIYQKKLTKFSKEDIVLIKRSIFYLIFRVLIPFCILIGLIVFLFALIYQYSWMMYAAIPLLLTAYFIFWTQIFRKLLKYLYDFTLVDPQGITTFKQKGILQSILKEIPGNRIRSIQVERKSLLENIFGFGSIEIHTDFSENMHVGEDDESPSVIGLSYVDKPISIKNTISDICFK